MFQLNASEMSAAQGKTELLLGDEKVVEVEGECYRAFLYNMFRDAKRLRVGVRLKCIPVSFPLVAPL